MSEINTQQVSYHPLQTEEEDFHPPQQKKAFVSAPWRNYQKIVFRISFVFFIIMALPNNIAWYKNLIQIDWLHLHYRDLYDISRFGSGITLFGNTIGGNALAGYATWIITLLVAIAAGLIWTAYVKWKKSERREYNLLYYWLRVVVRYRAGIGIIGFGFTKLLPVQMPYPSLGLLNTALGDFTAQKIYWLSVGIVPWYQVFAGVVEIMAGTFLFFRRTTSLGAILLFGALGDIVYVNFAYDGGVHVYSSYFVLLSSFLLVTDVVALYVLLIREKPVRAYHPVPVFSERWLRITRVALKSFTIVLFLGVLFWLQLVNFWYDPYKQPSVAGVKELRGNYEVAEFRINNRLLPHNLTDTVRWQEATFEDWSTLTFRVHRPLALDLSNGGGDPQRDINRTFEISGVGGGQRAFYYQADEVNRVLYLEDKYKAPSPRDASSRKQPSPGKENKTGTWISAEARKNIGNEVYKIDSRALSTRRIREYAKAPANEKRNRMVLQYFTEGDGKKVMLRGVNEQKDSLYIVLVRTDKKYALSPGGLKAGKYE